MKYNICMPYADLLKDVKDILKCLDSKKGNVYRLWARRTLQSYFGNYS